MNVLQSNIEKILFSKQFRRLEDKTQLFPTTDGDHFRNRLTHTLEVLAIGKRIAKEFNEIIKNHNTKCKCKEKLLFVNEDLVEAIALCHDIGHTPFGHVGERTINEIVSHKDTLGGLISQANNYNYQFFKHNIYSGYVLINDFHDIDIRIIDGAIKHTKVYVDTTQDNGLRNIVKKGSKLDSQRPYYSQIVYPYTIEGQIVSISDEIAQRCADFDDTFRSRYVNNIKAHVGIDDLNENLNIQSPELQKGGLTVYEKLVISIKEKLIYGLKKSFAKIISQKYYDFSNLSCNIVNYYGREIISCPYTSEEFKLQKQELSHQVSDENNRYEFLRTEEKEIFHQLQNGEKPNYTDSLKRYFSKREFDTFVDRFEIISTKHLDDKLTELSGVVTREYRIRSFDSGAKHVIRQIFKALYNDISQMENNQIIKMVYDYKSFLNRNNIDKITYEIIEKLDSNSEFKQTFYNVLKKKIDSSKNISTEIKKYLSEFDSGFYNSVSLIKKENEEKIINFDDLFVFINFIKKIDKFGVGPMTQKMHNIFLKHIAYYIANMTDGYARKIYHNLYNI